MTAPRPSRWRRTDARSRATIRRLLLAGAIVGLVAGVTAQVAVDTGAHGSDIEWLVRLSLVLPALIFIAWWLLSPGITLEEPEEQAHTPVDAGERLERIEATFDSAAVPRARRASIELTLDEDARDTYRASVRRDPGVAEGITPESFGVGRPAGRDADAV